METPNESSLEGSPTIATTTAEDATAKESQARCHNIYPTLLPRPPTDTSNPPQLRGINKASNQAWDGKSSHFINFSGKDETYGKPPEGSLTEQRAQRASQHINHEVSTLVSVIRGIGEKDKTNPDIVRVKFGRLFDYYTGISNKVAGVLLRARRWKLVEFTGEMLYQRQDDDKVITLLVGPDIIPTVREYQFYGQPEETKTESLKDKLQRLNSATR